MTRLHRAAIAATAAAALLGPAAALAAPASAATPAVTAAATAKAETPRNDYDGNARGFAQDNCTAFAAWRVVSRTTRKGFKNDYQGKGNFGDAQHWDDQARKDGITVDKKPAVGAIAVNDIHVQSSTGKRYGHVAYINKVYSDGSFDVEEYNWNHPLAYGTRSHMHISNVDPNFQWVIHF